MASTSGVQAMLAAAIRTYRQQKGMSQAQFAEWAQVCDLPWTRATVGAVEAGYRSVSLDEALWLQTVLDTPLVAMVGAATTPVVLEGVETTVSPAELRRLAAGEVTHWHAPARPAAWHRVDEELDARLATAVGRELGRQVNPDVIYQASHSLWDQPAAAEQDARLVGEGLDPRSVDPAQRSRVRGRRAHIGRAMVRELHEFLAASPRKQRDMARRVQRG